MRGTIPSANSKGAELTNSRVTPQSARDILSDDPYAERARLKVALRIEEERSIVFPETSIIIRDIQKLTTAVYGKDAPPKARNQN
ncbi:MAG: hypothetical protein WCR98_05775 [Saccharofermentanales bacterium]